MEYFETGTRFVFLDRVYVVTKHTRLFNTYWVGHKDVNDQDSVELFMDISDLRYYHLKGRLIIIL